MAERLVKSIIRTPPQIFPSALMISSDWTGQLRRDLHRWDDIVAQRWYYPWRWAEAEHHRDSGLRYGHVHNM